MGCSILVYTKDDEEINVTPGLRSMMHSILIDRCLEGGLNASDIPELRKAAEKQERDRDREFGWSQDVYDSFQKIIEIIERDGSCAVVVEV
jgi:hypothetical protein